MSEHTRRHVAYLVIRAILTAAIPVCWAIGWARVYGRLARDLARLVVYGRPLPDWAALDDWDDERLRRLADGLADAGRTDPDNNSAA